MFSKDDYQEVIRRARVAKIKTKDQFLKWVETYDKSGDMSGWAEAFDRDVRPFTVPSGKKDDKPKKPPLVGGKAKREETGIKRLEDSAKDSGAQGAYAAGALLLVFLAWALLGSPPYAFFTLLRYTSGITCLFLGLTILKQSQRMAPLVFILAGLSLTSAFGRFQKSDWVFVNWTTVCVVFISLVALAISRKSRSI